MQKIYFVAEGNSSGGHLAGGTLTGLKSPRGELSRVGFYLGDNSTFGILLGVKFFERNLPYVRVIYERELSGGIHPGGNSPGGSISRYNFKKHMP